MTVAPPPVVLPIFPLPDVTLFPGTAMPLHVFEARYRAMVVDALARDRRLCLVRLRPGFEPRYEGKPAVFTVGGAGEIVRCERLPTGRHNMVLRGLWRVRIEDELPTDTLYRVVRASPLPDGAPAGDASAVVARVRATCRKLLEALGRPLDALDEALGPDQGPGVVADRAAAAFVSDADLRQELLETLDVGRRLARLASVLDAVARELRGDR